ncbi:MAG: hypothetical protein AAF962_26085 [Actinomycetota bacterium]
MAVVSCTANLLVLESSTGDEQTRAALHSATVPALVFALVAGAYAASTDRRFGFIDQRLLTDPSRARWLGAKAVAQALVGLGYGSLGAATAVATSTIVFAARGDTFDSTSTVVVRALLGVILAAPLFAVIGAAIGSLTGNTSAIVACLLVWVLVIEPPTVLGLPEIGRWLPAAAGLGLTLSPDAALLGQVHGGVALSAYAASGLSLAARRFLQSDM